MEHKKLDLPIDAAPKYDIQAVFNTLSALGYTVSNIRIDQSVEPNQEEHVITVIGFDIYGLPVTNEVGGEVVINVGKSTARIFTVETVHEDHYYIQDVVISNFIIDNDPIQYKSIAIENLFHALLKTFLIAKIDFGTK